MQQNKNLEQIKSELSRIKTFYSKMISLYSIKDELIENKDDSALKDILNSHIHHNQIEINKLITTLEDKIKSVENIEKTIQTIENFNNFFNQDFGEGGTTSRYEKMKEYLSDSNLDSISDKINTISEEYSKIFLNGDANNDKLSDAIINEYNQLNDLYNDYFISHDSGKATRETQIQEFYEEIKDKYEILVSGYKEDNSDVESYFDEVKRRKQEFEGELQSLKKYYDDVFGSDDSQGLKAEIESRLKKLDEVEEKANKVIALSSDAGLAGGFHQKGKSAKWNKYISLGVFVLALLFIGVYNFNTINFDKLSEIDTTSLAVRFMINAPFIWIATVANINLNKYARLEEEYAYKESLAKSFERYKEEIEKLEDTESTKSKDLLAQLMITNLEAFKLNPADTMDKAKSDNPTSNITPKQQ
jgi:hypothetical protein